MSDVAQGPGWWLASDGRWYPPELAPADPSGTTPAPQWWTPAHVPAASVSSALATALRITFWIVAGLSGVRLLLNVAAWVTYANFHDAGTRSTFDTWRNVNIAGNVWTLPQALGSLTLLVLTIVWSWQAHRTVTSLGATPRWRIGWTIGAWFVCCAALVMPKLVLNSIERGALSPRRDGRVRVRWDTRATVPIGWVWWIALVLSFFRIESSSSSTGDAMRDAMVNVGVLNTAYAIGIVTVALSILAAFAGAAYFSRMSERLTPEGLAAHPND